jgi:hypothetical protein
MNHEAGMLVRYRDYIPERQYLHCWGYGKERLMEVDDEYRRPVYRALLSTLEKLSSSRRREMRERRFQVWAGDAGLFWVAVPGDMSFKVLYLLHYRLGQVPGLQTARFCVTPEMPLTPVFSFDRGIIGEYGGPGSAGQTYIDLDRYGTGLKIQWRVRGAGRPTGG